MKIDLGCFEQQINPTILKRGLSYFKKGAVEIISHTATELTAEVIGTEDYIVTLHLNGETIEEAICTCPYDQGAVCKHIAATCFALTSDATGIEANKTTSKPRKTKVQKESEMIAEILKNASRESLAQFIEAICKENREVRGLFIATMSPKDEAQSKSDYKSSLSAFAQSLKRRGFIDYSGGRKLGNAFYEVCDLARQRFDMGDYISAANAATAVIEQANAALQYTDDSSGCIGDPISVAVDLLHQITAEKLAEKSRLHLFKYCVKIYKKETFKGWGWHDDMLDIAVELVAQPKEITEVREIIEQKILADKDSWHRDQSQSMMARFINKTEGEEAAKRYKSQHLEVVEFRIEAIEELIEANDYTAARKLVDSALKKKLNREHVWLKYQFQLECLTGTTESAIALTRSIFISARNDYEPYFRKLKELVADDEWVVFRTALYREIDNGIYFDDKSRNITIWDKDWETYLKLVERSNHYGTLSDAESVLPASYRPQIVEQYTRVITANMSRGTHFLNRKEYQKATQAIRRMKKLGGIEAANALIEELRAKYPQRKALLEELNLV
ncbi:MAG: hypothetical protein SNG27_06360 [Rikenellaceae bacterium]